MDFQQWLAAAYIDYIADPPPSARSRLKAADIKVTCENACGVFCVINEHD